MMLFTTIKTSILPEFLSSGFIGFYSSSAQEFSQNQKLIAYTIVTNKFSLTSGDIALLLELPDDVKENLELPATIKDPIPISQISRIIFPSIEEKEMFYATYSSLPDIPLEMLDLSVNESIEHNSLEIYPSMDISKERHAINYNPSQFAAMLVGVKLAFEVGASHFNEFPNISLKYLSFVNFGNSFVKAVLDASGFSDATTKISFDFLDLYLSTADKSGGSYDKSFVSELSNDLENTLGIQAADHARKILNRVSKVKMGIANHPSLLDEPNNCLDYALYLACTVKDLEAFQYIKKNLRVGAVVECLAVFLVSSRLTLSQINKNYWRADKDSFLKILNAVSISLRNNVIDLEAINTHKTDDFSTLTLVKLNEIEISNMTSSPNHHVMLIVGMLQSCGYDPKPSEGGVIKIFSGDSSTNNPFEITLEHRISTFEKHRQNVVISTVIHEAAYLFNTKKNRQNIFEISNDKMVSIHAYAETSSLIITRSQLTDTMDKDEMEYHIELVKSAASDIQRLL